MLGGARNLAAGRGYVAVEAGSDEGRRYRRLGKAIDKAVDRRPRRPPGSGAIALPFS
jgi:hypothetical protein